jgi:hypothetical protein
MFRAVAQLRAAGRDWRRIKEEQTTAAVERMKSPITSPNP